MDFPHRVAKDSRPFDPRHVTVHNVFKIRYTLQQRAGRCRSYRHFPGRILKERIAMTEKKKHTMKDVARLAGVSTSTVSAVINNVVPVSPNRKRQVLEAMSALNYQPDAVARSLKTGRTSVVGVVVPDLMNAFYPEVVLGIEETARKAGYGVLLCDSTEDPKNELSHLTMLSSRRVDGVVLACCSGSMAYTMTTGSRFPIVFVDRLPRMGTQFTISSDNLQAGYLATRHLIDLGHKRIAMLAGDLALSTHHERLEGFRKAMQESHLPIRGEYMADGGMQIEDGRIACSHFFDLAEPPTALLASSNRLLFGVLQALDERGIRIPTQVSLIAFDDHVWNRYFNPSLTAISQSSFEMGKRAFELLLRLINGKFDAKSSETQTRLPTELRIRNSTAPPPRTVRGLQPALKTTRPTSRPGTKATTSFRAKSEGASRRNIMTPP
jgi:LacI family transcriptional regulator